MGKRPDEDRRIAEALQSLKADMEAQTQKLQAEMGHPTLLGAAMGAVDQLVNLTKALTKRQAQPPPELGLDRRAMVAAFLSACNAFLESRNSPKPSKITETHIWKMAGHKWPRQFQYWKAGTDRQPGQTRGATGADDRNFRRILSMQPAKFVNELTQKGTA
jgi:hypothetical protein